MRKIRSRYAAGDDAAAIGVLIALGSARLDDWAPAPCWAAAPALLAAVPPLAAVLERREMRSRAAFREAAAWNGGSSEILASAILGEPLARLAKAHESVSK